MVVDQSGNLVVCLRVTLLVNRFEIIAIEILDAVKEIELRARQSLTRPKLQTHEFKRA